MPVAVDDSEWPLVSVRWSGKATDDELKTALAALDRWLERGRFALLIDARGALGLGQDHRRAVVQFIRDNEARSERSLAVQAIVHNNAIQRALYIAIRFVAPMPFPSATFADRDEGLTWLRTRATELSVFDPSDSVGEAPRNR